MDNNFDMVRNKLIEINNQGLLLKAIAVNAGIDVNNLSRFKNGMDCLKKSEVETLGSYLKGVVIPQRVTVIKEPEKKKLTRKRSNVSLDLLCSLE